MKHLGHLNELMLKGFSWFSFAVFFFQRLKLRARQIRQEARASVEAKRRKWEEKAKDGEKNRK